MNDPLIRILKINRKPFPDFRKYTQNSNVISFLESYPIPQFAIKEINIIENLLKSGENYSNALKQYDSKLIPFELGPVQTIIKDIDKKDNLTLDYIHVYILNLYIPWVIFYENSHEFNNLNTLLDLIINLHETEYSGIAKDCFIYSFNLYIKGNTFNSFPLYFQSLLAFFLQFKNIQNDDFFIFPKLLSNLRLNNLDENIFIFMDEFPKIIDHFTTKIPKEVYDSLVPKLMAFLINLKEPSIRFYSLLINYISDNQIDEITSTLSVVICQHVISYSAPIPFPTEQETVTPLNCSFYIVNKFPSKPTFSKGLNFRFKTPDSVLPPLKSLENPQIMEIIQPFFNIFNKNKTSSIKIVKKINLFISRLEKEEGSQNYVLFNLYIALLTLIKAVLHHIINSVSFIELLYRKDIFNSSVYCLDPLNQSTEIVNMNILRTEAFKYILYDDTNRLTAFFDSFISSPIIFKEMIQRCIDNSHIIIAKIMESDILIEFISNSLILYQNLRYQGENIYDEASSKIFYLISLISQDKRARDLLFRDSFFCDAFLAQSYEVSPRNFVFSQIKSASDSLAMPNSFLKMFKCVFTFFPSPESIQLANEMLLLINDIIATNRSMIERYSIISKPLYDAMSLLDQTQGSAELLLSILLFFTEISYPISDHQYIHFSETIRKVYGNESDDAIFQRLIQFIAGDCLSSLNPSFIIRHPHATLMLFYMYSSSIEVINYIIKLCSFDYKNCVACHQGRLDFFVLETIKSIWDDESANKEYLEALFKLFEVISTSSCSIEIIEKFISLLSPINGKYLAPHYQLAIDTIFNIIRFEMKIPLYQMPLKTNKSVRLNETILFKKGFSFVTWLYIDYDLNSDFPILFKFWNEKNWSITITLRSNVINFYELGPSYNISSDMDSYLPTREWIKVAMTYYAEKIGIFCLYVNGILISTIRTALPVLTDLNFHFSFGGTVANPKNKQVKENSNNEGAKSKKISFLGPFALYPRLSSEHILSIFNENPNIFSPIEEKPYFIYLPTAINTLERNSFFSLFVGKCYLYLIIPIFSISYINFRNNERYKLLFESAVSILLESLSVCREVEDKFFEIGGFQMISYLLSDANPQFLTYHLYTRFFNLYQSLKKEKLQEVLFSHILVNISIWYVSEEQLLILKYINRIVLPSSDHLASIYFGFENILKVILSFYSTQETHRNRPESVDIVQCRRILYSMILLKIPKNSEFQFLLYCATYFNHDLDVKNELILFIDHFSKIQKEQFIKYLTKEESSISLLKLVQKSINITPISIITLISNLHIQSIINIDDYTSPVLVNINPATASVKLFEKLIDLVNNNSIYQWFPLLCYVGMQLPWDEAKSIQSVSAKKVSLLNDWFFWSVIWALELTKENQVSMMNFLAKGDPNDWIHICALIEKCSFIKGQSPDEPMSCFLSQVCHYIIITGMLLNKPISNYFQIVIGHHLFFRCTSDLNFYCNSIISETFGKNNVSNKSNIQSSQLSSFKKMSSSDIDHIITENRISLCEKENDTKIIQVHFGLRFDRAMEWKDFELAKTFLYIISSHKTAIDCDLYVLTAYFFAKTSHNEADIAKYINLGKQLSLNEQQALILSLNQPCDLTYFIEYVFYKKFSSLKVNFSSSDEKLFNFVRSKSVDANFDSSMLKGSLLWSYYGSSKIFKSDVFESINSNRDFSEDEFFPNSNQRKDRKLWKQLHKELTQEGKPWESTVLSKEELGRDSTLCSNGCPYKIMKKWKSAKQTARIIANEIIYGIDPNDEFSNSTEGESLQVEEALINESCTIIKINSPDEIIDISIYKSLLYLKRKKPRIIHISSIVSLVCVTYNSKQTAIEIILDDGKSYFFVFQTTVTRNQIFDTINGSIHQHHHQNMPFIFPSQKIVPSEIINSWKNHKISNFNYILLLNKMSGCSFNVETQYPIFPRILENFNDINSIRDFNHGYSYSQEPPLFYLQRLDPFYKISKRSFDDVSQISKKFELTPEFFYLPEFLTSEIKSQNVVLPNWAKSPFDFVYKCRKILESEEISQNLNKWIDIIWGNYTVVYCNYLPLFEAPHPKRLKSTEIQMKDPIYIENDIKTNSEESEKIELESGSKILCESENWVAFIQRETATFISLKKKSSQNHRSMDFSFNFQQISSAFISESFHTIAIGVDEGKTIFVHSLEHNLPVFLIHMEDNNRADLISISNSWGFIIVISKFNQKSITLFNINGLFIKQIKTDREIEKIVCWSNKDDFDYMALADINGNIFVTEIYELSESTFAHQFYLSDSKISCMKYDKSNETLIIHTESGKEIIKSV